MGPDGGITVDPGSDGHGHREGMESPGKSRLMKSYEDLNMLLPLLPVRLQCVLQLPLEISAKISALELSNPQARGNTFGEMTPEYSS